MNSGPRFRPVVVAAREKLAQGREKLRAQHDGGSPGVQVCACLTDLMETVLLDLYRAALAQAGDDLESVIALTAHGGFGRREVAPYSDLDLMMLHQGGAEGRMAPFVRRLTQSIYDSGLQLGFSLRTPEQACSLALKDATVFTSLVESRYLGGNAELFARFARAFRLGARRRAGGLIDRIEEARREERRQFGETVYLLEPNVKRSRGGLRDIQLIRWIGVARYGEPEPENLVRCGALSKEDEQATRGAREFLLRLRNEMHFHAGKSQDLLDRDEQLRLADLYGHQGDEHLLPVERFLRQYIEHTNEVRYAVAHFVAGARMRSRLLAFVEPLFSHQVGGDFRVGPAYIGATRRGLQKVCSDLCQALRLMDLANRYNTRIDHSTWQAIRTAMMRHPSIEVSRDTAERFLSLISQPGRLGDLLRRLHELRVLEKIVPAMKHARCLMQFNEYHKYTVDEHSIRAVQCATEFLHHQGPLGEAYRGIENKRTLHLALLIHDLGKGYREDHSEMGRRLAEATAAQLGLPEGEAETLKFLVHKHLLLSHLAQRRDINDDSVVLQLAVAAGSADILQMLYVLTCADLAAVGPGVLNSWKLDLITQLYFRARQQLAGDSATTSPDEVLSQRRRELCRLVKDKSPAGWWDEQIAALPRSYLLGDDLHELVDRLEQVRQLRRDDAVAWGRYLPERSAVEYTVGSHEQITPGIFHKLTGALTSKGMQILSAEIHTLADDVVLDRFFVQDTDYADQPPDERLEEVNRALIAALKDHSGKQPVFRKLWTGRSGSSPTRALCAPTQVRIDNSTSDRFTIVDIFAHDRMGLLYTIARAIFALGLSVHVAKIGTYLDQVADVFYVTDQQGGKIVEERRLSEIRQKLFEEIERFES